MRILTAKGTFDGLYEWGRGWRSLAAKQAWDKYWSGASGIHWHTSQHGDALYLVAVGGAVYLHPEGFRLLYEVFGSEYRVDAAGRRVKLYSAVDELRELLYAYRHGLLKSRG